MAFNEYKNISKIGQGQVGIVYRAYDPKLSRNIAIKVLKQEYNQNEEFVERFRREAKLFANLDNPHILPIYSFDYSEDHQSILSFITKYAERGSLATALKDKNLTGADQRNFINHIGDALSYIHKKGVIHRDIKPSNILIDGENRFLLGDFGIADNINEKEALTKEGVSIGTVQYMSPEQFEEGKEIDFRSDLFSFGVVCYEVFTGVNPFNAKDYKKNFHQRLNIQHPTELNPEISPALEKVLLRSLAYDREERFQTAETMVEALLHALDNPGVSETIMEKPNSGLDDKQTGEVQAVTHAWKKGNISEQELKKLIGLASELLEDLDNLGQPMPNQKEVVDIIKKRWNINQKLEVSLPIIPSLVNYTVEFEKGAELRMLWDELVSKGLQKNSWLQKNYRNRYFVLGGFIFLIIIVQSVMYLQNLSYFPTSNSTPTSASTQVPTKNPGINNITPSPNSSTPSGIDNTSSPNSAPTEQSASIQASTPLVVVPTVEQVSIGEILNPQCLPTEDIESINTEVISPDNVNQITQVALLGKGIIHNLAWSPNGKVLAIATSIGIYLLDANTLEELRYIDSDGISVWSVAFSPDGAELASGNSNSSVWIYNSNTGVLLTTLEATSGLNRGASSIAYSPNGNFLAASGFYATVWDTNTWEKIESLSGETNNTVISVDFSPDGSKLLTANTNGEINIWNTDNFGSADDPEISVDTSNSSTIISFNSDGLTFASAESYGAPSIRDIRTGRLLSSLEGHTDTVLSLDFSPNGLLLATGGTDKTIKLWEVKTGKFLTSIEEFTNNLVTIVFSPTENLLAVATDDGSIWLWDISSLEDIGYIARVEGYTAEVTSVAFHPSGHIIAVGSKDNTVSLWNIESRQLLYKLIGHTAPVRSVAFSPDGCLIASGGEDNMIRLWDAKSGEFIRQFEGHTYYVTQVIFSPDGRLLATGSEDGTARLWNVDGQQLYILEGHANQYSVTEYLSLDFSLDNSKLISAGSNSEVRVWSTLSGELIHKLELGDDNHKVLNLTTSSIGSLLAIATLENIQIWNVDTFQFLRKLQRDYLYAYSIAFSPDGNLLASASRSAVFTSQPTMVIEFWNPYTDILLDQFYYSIVGHSDEITSISFSPNGNYLVSGSRDGTIIIWGINP